MQYLEVLCVIALVIRSSYSMKMEEFCDTLSETTCIVKSNKIMKSDLFLNRRDILFSDSIISLDPACTGNNCYLILNAQTLELVNSTLAGNVIELSVTIMTKIKNSVLSADYVRQTGVGDSKENRDKLGSGYASWGSSCDQPNFRYKYGDPRVIHNISQTEALKMNLSGFEKGINISEIFQGSGSGNVGDYKIGYGGGRVALNTTNLFLEGSLLISANGNPQTKDVKDCSSVKNNGGSGGYIFLGVNSYLKMPNGNLQIEANGGIVCGKPLGEK